jgi:hypothetical protein
VGASRHFYKPSQNSGCVGAFLFESTNASVEIIPAMIMEDVHAAF